MSKEIKRNDPCPCGSGQKYKKCCGAPISQSSAELKNHLLESLEFLIKSCIFYDSGDIAEGKRISLELRKLLHDTGKCTSILSNLKLKNTNFISTSCGYNEKNLISTFALTSIKMSCNNNESSAEYVPFLDDNYKNTIPFDQWWNDIIIYDMNKNKFLRKDIVLFIADQDGGAHVDEGLEQRYYDLTRNNTVGFKFFNKNEERDLENVHLATVRQIAHEVIRTFEVELRYLDKKQYIVRYNKSIKENNSN